MARRGRRVESAIRDDLRDLETKYIREHMMVAAL
jgi:hypothetical protein